METEPYRARQDAEHLRVLAICNYVFAGLTLLGILAHGLFFFLLVRPGFSRAAAEDLSRRLPEREFPPLPHDGSVSRFMAAFVIMAVVLYAIGLTAAVLSVVNGNYLRRARHRGFSMIVGALQCLAMPLGTVLGVFTLIVLGRPSVVERYAALEGGAPLAEDDRSPA